MGLDEVVTPCLVLDLDALERNIDRMAALARARGVNLRPHGKMHKSVDVARLQIAAGAVGLCCQKVSEAEAFVRAGISDVLVSNEVRDPRMLIRLARLPLLGARVAVCTDDADNVAELSAAVQAQGTALDVLVEFDSGAGRCGVPSADEAVTIARAIAAAPGLRFRGLQAYHGALQHIETFEDRREVAEAAIARTRTVVEALAAAGLPCDTVTGGGTGSADFEAASGLYTELQCGSYAFMDADYGRILDRSGARLDATFDNALFLLTRVMSRTRPGQAVVDAGLKSQSLDSGLPLIHGRADLRYAACSDEHGTVTDPEDTLAIGDALHLVPGHCDPTCNLHDWYVGMRGDTVECLWPVTARGKSW
ncbi:DSD1 family PLP-dependent enzyme [Salipiger sp.]|uniref:DSD1 family PLP-dependent enzyme n=1 Tax=Salipiger sp. TaxID=2078585 RepID=UPI003A96FF47